MREAMHHCFTDCSLSIIKVADWQTMVTNWPSSLTMAATWDTALMREYGAACGAEQRGKGMQVCESPE